MTQSTILTSNTNITQPFPFPTQNTSPRNYEPPPVSLHYSTHIFPHKCPPQGASNAPIIDTSQNTPQVQYQTICQNSQY